MRRDFCILFVMVLIWSIVVPQVANAEVNDGFDAAVEFHGIPADSCCDKFNAKQLILPGTLIAVGAFGVDNGWFKRINGSINDEMAHIRGSHHFRADNVVQYLPLAGYVGLGELKGGGAKHSLRDRAIIAATSFAVMCAMVQPVKHIVGERRPDKRDFFESFPSGHTSTAFMGAELVRSEYSLGAGIAAYGVACGVGFLRLYNNRHWLNDVVAGAGFGILSARIGIWMLPVWKRLFHFGDDACRKQMSIVPSYDINSQSLLMSGIMCF